jgi:glycosyltransferase involved in cell wall biosynthesis
MSDEIVVLILTYNEKENIETCIQSVKGWADDIKVIDSGSTDGTIEILKNHDVQCINNPFLDFSKQRNFAIDQLNSDYTGWVLFLDADEYLTTEIKQEISVSIKSDYYTNYFLNRKFFWQKKWIKRGYYPCHIIRLFKNGFGRCEDRTVNEHLIVDGPTGFIKEDFVHECKKPISFWIEKHIKRAQLEANELTKRSDHQVPISLFKNKVETKRWIRFNIWERLPIFIRPFMLFFFRLIFQRGILDGKVAFGYHFLQTLWFTTLIDIYYLEARLKKADTSD